MCIAFWAALVKAQMPLMAVGFITLVVFYASAFYALFRRNEFRSICLNRAEVRVKTPCADSPLNAISVALTPVSPVYFNLETGNSEKVRCKCASR